MADIFIHTDVVGVDIVDSEVRLRVGDATKEQGWSKDAAIYGLAGFVSVPLPPENGEAAQALCLDSGNSRRVIATRDNRLASKAGALKPGDAAIFCDNEARLLLKRDTDTISLYSKNANTDQSMLAAVNGQDGVISLVNGEAFLEIGADYVSMGVKDGCTIKIGKDSVDVFGNAFQAAVNLCLLGWQVPGLQMAPNVPTNAVAVGVAGPVNVVSTKVFVGL